MQKKDHPKSDSGQQACGKRFQLVDYVYGVLEKEKEVSITDHLVTCSDCREELAQLQAAKTGLDQRPVPEPDPEVMADYLLFLKRITPDEGLDQRVIRWFQRWFIHPPVALRFAEIGLAVVVGIIIGGRSFSPNPPATPSVIRIYADAATLQRVLGDAEMIILETVNSDATTSQIEADLRTDQSLKLLGLAAELRGQRIKKSDPDLDDLLYQLTDIIGLISNLETGEEPKELESIREKVLSSHILARISTFRNDNQSIPVTQEGI